MITARYSTLEPNDLATFVDSHWTLGEPVKCVFFHRGENDNYRIEVGDQRFCLRVYRTRHSQPKRVESELRLLAALDSQDLGVSSAIETHGGNLFELISACEGPRAVALFSWAPGVPAKRESTEGWDLFGRGLGQLHLASISHSSHRSWDQFSLLTHPSQHWVVRMEQSGLDSSEVQVICDQLEETMAPIWDQLPQSFVHGDAAGGNAHISESGSLTWFDFLWSGVGPSVWDLATFRRGAGQFDENWQSALQAYERVRVLSTAERKAIPVLAAIRCVFTTSLILDECDIDLHGEATPAWFERRLHELRRLMDGSHWSP